MRQKISWILATVAALLGMALIVGSIIQRGRVTILHHKAAPNTYDFLVFADGSLILARQGIGTDASFEGSASEFGTFSFSTRGSTPLKIAAGQITVQGSQITLKADPITGNIRHGFLWTNLNGATLSTPLARVQLTCRAIGAPMWILGAPLLLPLAITSIRNRRSVRRRRAGLCVCCGYDLRASPERCPECGQVATPGAVVT
jgi:hypothetical protein